ncbi:putative N-acetyltransferase YhbS [Pararhizobium capsulatum DSM 1112]|uniref:N-acetyltransferase YhbS n=1 Tax=Pararhizobium capsulatum DSM 1112 TaxID=1121113 RepID=A0ABU0BLL4_9HYPH|nr:GNAT family N-acetyltransferase [Pararhizobium capsulatum]MDQ0318591.1 putative N-acetyltransferase YhbS [Pararhizobium capsulatum DSM 1112]
MPGAEGLTYREDYFADPAAWRGLVNLLHDTFGIDVGQLDRLGGPDPTSRAFAYFDEAGVCVANFSLFSMPMVIDGRAVRAVGYQSGAVRPEWRGRGLYRDLMQRAFAWANAAGCELELLLTDKPALYEAYGFRAVAEHDFKGLAPMADSGVAKGRLLDLDNPGDLALTTRLLATRAPVSSRFAVTRQGEMFLLSAVFDGDIRLSYSASLDLIVAWQMDGAEFKVLDVVAAKMPPLSTILAAIGTTATEVTVCFPPDKLGWEGEALERRPHAGLMIRGNVSLIHPLALSPMAGF